MHKSRKIIKDKILSSKDVSKTNIKYISSLFKENINLNDKETFLQTYISYFYELDDSYEKLKRFPLFLSLPNKTLISRNIADTEQFIYHIENYLSGVYIFEQRAKIYIGYIIKMAKKYNCNKEDIEKLNMVKDILLKNLKPVVIARGEHTHVMNFFNAQFSVEVLYLKVANRLRVLTKSKKEKQIIEDNIRVILKRQKMGWGKQIKKNNAICEKLLIPLYEIGFNLKENIYKKML